MEWNVLVFEFFFSLPCKWFEKESMKFPSLPMHVESSGYRLRLVEGCSPPRSHPPRAIYVFFTYTRSGSSFVQKIRSKFELTDTMCSCDGGLRTVGCAHSIAILRYIDEVKSGKTQKLPTRSQIVFEQSFIQYDSMRKYDLESDSEYDSDD